MTNYTVDQEKAINSYGKNTLVSASAGSGKTTILKTKVAKMVTCQHKGIDHAIDIDKMIIVTFTKASARDLKSKVYSALTESILNNEYDVLKLREQIDNLPLANISTIHSLCANIIRENFTALENVDPAFGIIEESEGKMLLNRAINIVLAKKNLNITKEYSMLRKFLNYNVVSAIEKIYYEIQNQSDIEKFINENIDYMYSIKSIEDIPIFKDYVNDLIKKFINIVNYSDEALRILDSININDVDIKLNEIETTKRFFEDNSNVANILLRDRTYNGILNNLDEAKSLIPNRQKSITTKYSNYDNLRVISKYKGYISNVIKLIKNLEMNSIEELEEKRIISKVLIDELVDIEKQVIAEYQLIKFREKKLDFNDLEHNMVKLLNIDSIREELQCKYEFICVDEYQDVNPVQEKILTLLSNGKNMFMVGDLKQSIYGFRNAEPDVFANKYKNYRKDSKDGTAINLNVNFRSRLEIINVINEIFNNIMTENFGKVNYKDDAQLNLGAKYLDNKTDFNKVEICMILKDKEVKNIDESVEDNTIYSVKNNTFVSKIEAGFYEGKFIASKIQNIIKSKLQILGENGELRNVTYSDIAVIFRSRGKSAMGITKALFESSIPLDDSQFNKNEKNESIDLLISYLEVINNWRQDIPLCSVLASPLVGLSLTELAKIRQNVGSKTPFYIAVEQYNLDDSIKYKLNEFLKKVKQYRFESKFKPASKIMEQIIEDYLYDEIVLSKKDGDIELEQLKTFINSLENKQYNFSISSFLSMVKEYDKISDVKISKSLTNDCVKLLTIHASKGLEYPIVFYANVNKKINHLNSENVIFDNKYGLAIKDVDMDKETISDSILYKIVSNNKKFKEKEEELRNLYVALTRAKEYLFITGEIDKSNCKSSKTDGLVEDMNSYMDWILYAMGKTPGGFIEKAYKEISLEEIETIKNENQKFYIKEEKQDVTKELLKYLEDDYKYKESTQNSLLWSATEINKLSRVVDIDSGNMLPDVDKKYYLKGNNIKTKTTQEGIAYHRVLEGIDFACYTLVDVENEIDRLLDEGFITQEQLDVIDPEIIFKCLNNEYIKKARYSKPEKEKKFSLLIPAKEVLPLTNIEDKVFVRGAIDLFIPKYDMCDENILVDFKYSGEDLDTIKKTYEGQLRIYEMALKYCYGIKLDKKIIYVIGQDKVIEFPLNDDI